MKIMLLGRTGQLGWELHRSLATFGEVAALDYPEIDLTRIKELLALCTSLQPDLVINAAAYTDVDRAESEPEKARLANGEAPAALNEFAQRYAIPFIHYSTDYVFDGTKGSPYTEQDLPNPINAYGASKLAGEQAIQQVGGKYMVFRTSWVYSNRRGGFVNKILEKARTQKELRVVTDQVGSPTWARLLADVTVRVVDMMGDGRGAWRDDLWGLYHLAGAGSCSRYEWAKEIVDKAGLLDVAILPAASAEFPAPARRPGFTGLSCEKFVQSTGITIPPWQLSTAQCLDA